MTKKNGNKQTSKAPKKGSIGTGKTTSKALVIRAKPSATLSGGMQKQGTSNKGKLSMPSFAIAQVDAFCPEAFGCKVPDDATAPTSIAYSRDEYSLSTTATGGAGIALRYHPISVSVPPTVVTGTTWTWPATFGGSTFVANAPALQAAFSTVRAVAHGVKITTRQSAFAASGFVHVALVADNNTALSTWAFPTSVSAMEYSPYYKRIPLADLIEDEVLVMNKFTDHTAFRYLDINHGDNNAAFATAASNIAYTYGFPAGGWMTILIWVEGPASVTNAIDIEVIHHYECLSTQPNGIIAITAAAPCSPAVLAATSYLVEHTEPISVVREDEDNVGPFWRDVATLFSTGLRVASGLTNVAGMATNLFTKMFL